MIQSITIEVPEGKKAVFNKELMKIEFKSLRPESWEEYIKDYNSEVESINLFGLKLLDSEKKGILGLIKLKRLYSVWIGSWKNDFSKDVFYIKNLYDGLGITKCNSEHNFLEFPDQLMAEEFLSCFKDIIKDASEYL